ncbi:MAG: ATP-binding protein [Bacteroidales bacterium]
MWAAESLPLGYTFGMSRNKNIGSRVLRVVNHPVSHHALAIVLVAAVALIFAPFSTTLNYHVVSFILLLLVSILSTFLGIGPVLVAATGSAVVWNFFFIPPHGTFHIERAEDILIFSLFFIIALVNGILTTRVRRQEVLARERERRTNALFQLTKELSKASGIDQVLQVAIDEIRDDFGTQPFFILQDGNNILHSSGRLQKERSLSPEEYKVAEWAFRNSSVAGAHTPESPDVAYTFYPLSGTRTNPGVLAVRQDAPMDPDQQSFWDTFVVQISNALEREFLAELAQKVRFLDESDRLYRTLFNSISHELRIPVATIMGASDSIINTANGPEVQSALCQEIFTASMRLNRLIENLLNMSRLESGHISVRPDWYDLTDLVNKLSEDLKEDLAPFDFQIRIPQAMPLVKIDYGLMEQVLYNLLFNATQYTPEGSAILLRIDYRNGELVMEVEDEGPGFPEEELKNVFRKFFRVDQRRTGGLGLGLSIVKGFVQAHGGTIEVTNGSGSGAHFLLRIPTQKQDLDTLA